MTPGTRSPASSVQPPTSRGVPLWVRTEWRTHVGERVLYDKFDQTDWCIRPMG